MKHVKAFLQSKKGLILVFAAAAILILAGGIGGTRAALSVYSEQYNSRLQTSDIGISLYENEILAAQRDYDPDAGNYSWKESGTGLLCQKLIGLDGKEDAELKIGKSYQEIAEMLGRHVKSIDNALQRVKRKLTHFLEEKRNEEL